MEFALIFPVFLLLVYGGLSFGLAMSTQAQVAEAAADGARAAIGAAPVGSNYCTGYQNTAEAVAENALGGMGGRAQLATVTAVAASTPANPVCANPGVTMTVTITYPYGTHPVIPNAPGLGLVLPPTVSSSYVVQVS